jgi:hypothetical protein
MKTRKESFPSTPEQEQSDLSIAVSSAPRAPRLPVYKTILGCSAETGIPVEVLKAAKREGCPAFTKGYSVDLELFLRWYFDPSRKHGEDPVAVRIDYQRERALRERAQRKLLEQQYEFRQHEYIKFAEVEKWLGERIVRPLAAFFLNMPTAWSRIVNPTDPATGKAGLEQLARTIKEMLATLLTSRPETAPEDDTETGNEAVGDLEPGGEDVAG